MTRFNAVWRAFARAVYPEGFAYDTPANRAFAAKATVGNRPRQLLFSADEHLAHAIARKSWRQLELDNAAQERLHLNNDHPSGRICGGDVDVVSQRRSEPLMAVAAQSGSEGNANDL